MLSRLFLNKKSEVFSYKSFNYEYKQSRWLEVSLRAYQALQEIHRISTNINLLILGNDSDELIRDLDDFPRISSFKDRDHFLRTAKQNTLTFDRGSTNVIYVESREIFYQSKKYFQTEPLLDYIVSPVLYSFFSTISICGQFFQYSHALDCYCRQQTTISH